MPEIPMLDGLERRCQCYAPDVPMPCVCGPTEKFLRAVAHGESFLLPVQRDWCLAELARIEGWMDHVDEYRTAPGATVADAVLRAWQDAARDKGPL